MARLVSVWCQILVLAALLAAPAPAATQQPAAHMAAACSKVVFFGLRGSGEGADPDQLNMGETVYSTYQAFERNARAAGIAVTGIGLDESEYPAIPVWSFSKESLVLQNVITQSQASVVTGAASLGGKLVPFLARDLSTCIVLVGYSQGAWAIGDALLTANSTIDERVLARISGVVLFGDPRLDPTSDIAQGDLGRPGVLRDPIVPSNPRLPTQG
ncbi:MAG: cutinase family protein, partial [Actinomycetes bacterium]